MLMTDKFLLNLKPTTIIDGEPALKPGQANRDLYDAEADGGVAGLSVRLSKKGKKTFNFFYKTTRMKLGVYPALSLSKAREAAKAHRETLNKGRDPSAPPPLSADMTMKQLIDLRLKAIKPQFDENGNQTNKKVLRTAKAIEANYKKHVLPKVGTVLVKDFNIRQHFFEMILDPIYDDNHARMAGLVGTELKKLFKFARGRGAGPSPIEDAEFDLGLNVKDRFLSTDEITMFWYEMPTFVTNISMQRILKLLFFTGCRISEICGLHRDEVDLSKGVITISKDRVKNGKDHGAFQVPLSPQAATILGQAMRDTNNPDWVFPNKSGDGPMPSSSVQHQLCRMFKAKNFSIDKFTPHDLRRTITTHMTSDEGAFSEEGEFAEYGMTEKEMALILNHQSTTVTGIHYNKNKYLKKKRDILVAWAAFIDKVTKTTTSTNQLMAAE